MIASIDTLPSRLIGLSRHEIRSFPGRCGQRIESRRGSVWITQDGDPRDVVIAGGQSHALDRDGPVYVQALDAACVQLPDAAPSPRHGLGLWQRLLGAGLSAASS